MDATRCDKVRELVEQGWQQGLTAEGFQFVAAHLSECEKCANWTASLSRVNTHLKQFALILERASPRRAIADRVFAVLEGTAAGTESTADEEHDLARFLARVGREQSLRRRVAGGSDREARLGMLIALGREQGFRFSEATVVSTLARREAANDGELTDDQLEAVAGGASAQFALLQELLGPNPTGGSGGSKNH